MPRIYITEPNHFYTYELPATPGAEVRIGTSPQCQLALPGVGGLAELHASISCQPQGYVITDMGSPAGTLANGVPIRTDFLRPGVEYRMGNAVITLAAEGAPAPQQGYAPQGYAPAPQGYAPAPQGYVPQPGYAQQPAPQQPAGEQPAAKKPLKKASPLKTGAAASSTKVSGKKLNAMASKFDRGSRNVSSNLTYIYVLVLLIVAFYAGIALHHWERTGNCLPGLVADKPQAPARKAPASESEPQQETATAPEQPAADGDAAE